MYTFRSRRGRPFRVKCCKKRKSAVLQTSQTKLFIVFLFVSAESSIYKLHSIQYGDGKY